MKRILMVVLTAAVMMVGIPVEADASHVVRANVWVRYDCSNKAHPTLGVIKTKNAVVALDRLGPRRWRLSVYLDDGAKIRESLYGRRHTFSASRGAWQSDGMAWDIAAADLGRDCR